MVKKIHYIWLGNNPKSKLIKKCIRSWRKHFPDWEIIEWNESNLDINTNEYVKKAYEEKKYAFASDYFRFDILSKEGGLYLDTDVEVIRPFEDLLKEYNCVMGFEFNKQTVNPGLVMYAAKCGNRIIAELGSGYLNRDFSCRASGIPKTICEHTTDYLMEKGFVQNDSFQIIEDVAIFPSAYFCPVNREWSVQNFTKETRCIHHYGASWLNKKYGAGFLVKRTCCKLLGKRGISLIKRILKKEK